MRQKADLLAESNCLTKVKATPKKVAFFYFYCIKYTLKKIIGSISNMQRFRIKVSVNNKGLIAMYMASDIQDIIDILKKHEPHSMVHSPTIMFYGSDEFLHLLRGSLLINGLDKEICSSNVMSGKRDIPASSYCTYIDQLDY